MKIKRFILIFLSLIILSSTVIPAYATIDDNRVAILPPGYPSPSYYSIGSYIGDDWSTFIDESQTSLANMMSYRDDDFKGVVYYNQKLLIDSNGSLVYFADEIKPASRTIYSYLEGYDLITIENDTIKFNKVFDTFTLIEFVSIVSEYVDTNFEVSYAGYYNDQILIDGNIISFNGSSLKADDRIDSDTVYTLNGFVCENHTWNLTNVIRAATCKIGGLDVYTCRICKQTKTEESPINSDNHKWITIKYYEPTCRSTGYQSIKCEWCQTAKQFAVDMISHKFTELTCTTNEQCEMCGFVKTVALGHDYGEDGLCKRDGCDGGVTIVEKDPLDEAKDKLNEAWNVVTGAAGDAWTWLSGGVSGAASVIVEVVTPGEDNKIFGIEIPQIDISGISESVINGINIVIAIVGAVALFITIYYVSKMVANFAQARKNRPQRTRRKRK